jgi:hypothetical protein
MLDKTSTSIQNGLTQQSFTSEKMASQTCPTLASDRYEFPLTVYLLNDPNIGITDTAATVCEQCKAAFVFDLPDIITDG